MGGRKGPKSPPTGDDRGVEPIRPAFGPSASSGPAIAQPAHRSDIVTDNQAETGAPVRSRRSACIATV